MQIALRILVALAFLAVGYWVSMSMYQKDEKSNKSPKHTQAQAAKSSKPGSAKKDGKQKSKGKKTKVVNSGGNIRLQSNGQETTVTKLTPVDYQVKLYTQGTVRPRTETKLNALVSGSVKHISEQLQDGAFFKQGDLLVELDPTDFQSRIITAQASLARAEANLAQEKARAAQALRNWKDIGFDDEPNDLVLRKPQLKEAEANVAAQQAAVARAERDLARTKIYAPFHGRVRKRNIGPAQSINANSSLADIYTTDYAEVRLPLSARQLTQIQINEQGNQAIEVTLTDALNDSNKTTWKAIIKHVEGELDATSRELNVIAHISDPFGNQSGHPPLRINQPVKAAITANTISKAFVIDRKHLYGANEILLIEDGKVLRQEINIDWSTSQAVITTDSQLEGKLLATSRINYAKTGTPVNIIEDDTPEEEPAAKDAKNANQPQITTDS